MEPVKIPRMEREEYDAVIERNFLCRLALKGGSHPYVAPFLYVFDGSHMYFLPTRYGKKLEYAERDPRVTVEVEEYEPDFSSYRFVTLHGRVEAVEGPEEERRVRELFVDAIRDRGLSSNVLRALGHAPDEPVENLMEGDRTLVWKLVDVERITALRD